MKIRLVEAELYHAGGQTGKPASLQESVEADMTEIIVVVRNFANMPNNTWRWPVAGLPTGSTVQKRL